MTAADPEIDEWLAEAEDRDAHFRESWGGYQALHENCAPETGGCPYKSEAENRADLEAWYEAQEAAAVWDAAEAAAYVDRAELDPEPEAEP